MSHTIAGIDIGSWSVKFTAVDVGLRRLRVASQFEQMVPAGDTPLAERQAQAIRAGLTRLPSETLAYLALPGEMLTLRVLELPFADARKVEQVVGFELEGQIMHDLGDVVMDHVILSAQKKEGAEETGSRALVVAAKVSAVSEFLESMKACGVDPRALLATPLVYHTLFAGEPARKSSEPAGFRIFMDMGHRRTNLCAMIGDETVFGRTIMHGGEELTAALQRASDGAWNPEQAEQGKAQHGFVHSAARPATTPAQEKISDVIREALGPLLRDIRQTLASLRGRDQMSVEAILLAGGGAQIDGLPEFLEEELEISVHRWGASLAEAAAVEAAPRVGDGLVQDRFALSQAIAWAGARGQRELNLRRGPFEYRASFSVVRQKAGHLAALTAALLLCAAVDGGIALRRLSSEKAQLKDRLKTATQELFGEPRMDATAVTAALKKRFGDEMAPLPRMTAYDLLDQISRKMPAKDKVQIDIQDLEIKAKKTTMKGTVDSAAAVDEVVSALKEIDCFDEINKGPVTEVSGGAKQFSLSINSKCP